MKGFIKKTLKLRKGVVGNTEFWTDEDWESHKRHVEELKSKGEYLQEYKVTVYVEPSSEFDQPNILGMESDRVIILDLKEDNDSNRKHSN